MKANRREFIATAAGALATLGTTRLSARQTSRLTIVFEGLAVLSVNKPTGSPTGLPKTTERLDVVFLQHKEHDSPVLIELGTYQELDMTGRALKISVNGEDVMGTVLGDNAKEAARVVLDDSAPDTCDDKWDGLRNVPHFERLLNQRVDMLPAVFSDAPKDIASRLTFRRGSLRGLLATGAYKSVKWRFPGGPADYVQRFTDHVIWTTTIDATSAVAVQAMTFDGKAIGTPLNAPRNASGDVRLIVGSARNSPVSDPKILDHFAHYYHVLDYSGPKPVPHQDEACSTVRTKDLQDLETEINAWSARLRRSQKQEDCGDAEIRGETGICMNAVAYTTVK
ncbi:MAG TPA: hypothetical protein VNT81_20085 [Vicinamibacterales bacterium]|nr:hypothetical protein [Vicinamibacterales bacterium]